MPEHDILNILCRKPENMMDQLVRSVQRTFASKSYLPYKMGEVLHIGDLAVKHYPDLSEADREILLNIHNRKEYTDAEKLIYELALMNLCRQVYGSLMVENNDLIPAHMDILKLIEEIERTDKKVLGRLS